jgi:AhpD family alkylhydroperoxidase
MANMNKFPKRDYHSLGQFWRDVRYIMRHGQQMRVVMRHQIPPAFRERLMLTVTAVNRCRYCSYFHAHEALMSGIPPEEVEMLQDGILNRAPADEIPALLYAQHWAEANAQPDPAARARLVETYGAEMAAAIEFALRMIHTANLLGNSWDHVLYRLSFGRWGLPAEQRPATV